ncbi:MAG: beta-galactosidase [Clostridiales bacterium]|nr:beta-galactosidase [Clostridiales bacterium]
MLTHKDNQFYLNGEKFDIHSGAVHYFRSFPEQWEGLLTKLKNCGLNTVETYCCWNMHEPEEGKFCFEGMLDIERFIQTAQKVGLYVIIRPGPYICAEWDLGALPGWLLKDPDIRLRSKEPSYFSKVENYMAQLMKHVTPYLETKGGPVIMMMVENEYGSFGNDLEYMNESARLLRKLGVDIALGTADGHTLMHLNGGHTDYSYLGIDFGYTHNLPDTHLQPALSLRPDEPLLHAEHWIGQFAHWGNKPQAYAAEYVANEVKEHLEKHVNFNLYMFHGGTNWGFNAGANSVIVDVKGDPNKRVFAPDITSYDYDAPLNEWGDCTPKYFAIQKEMEKHLGVTLPKPAPIETQVIGKVALNETASLFDNLENIGGHFTAINPRCMEHYGQSQGYILYRAQITTKQKVKTLIFTDVKDRAHVYFNGVLRGVIDRNDEKQYMDVDGWMDEGGTLELLVDNLGHINFGPDMLLGDRKGICGHVIMANLPSPRQVIFNWDVYTLPMNNLQLLEYKGEGRKPAFYRGTFKAEKKLDCFIHLDHFTKGFVTVNGFNLGRFWNVGPQQSLYLPWPLLKDENEIIVFDEEGCLGTPEVEITDQHILNSFKSNAEAETVV